MTTTDLHSDLCETSDWAFQWKLNFNPDPNKKAQKVIFRREKLKKLIILRYSLIKTSSTQKHLGMVLDTKLDFNLQKRIKQGK